MGSLKVELPQKKWFIGIRILCGLFLLGAASYFIFYLYDLMDGIGGLTSFFLFLFFAHWIPLGIWYLVPPKVVLDSGGIKKRYFLFERVVPYEEIEKIKMYGYEIAVKGDSMFWVSIPRMAYENFESAAELLSEKVKDRASIEYVGDEEYIEAFKNSEQAEAYLNKPSNPFSRVTRQGWVYFTIFLVAAAALSYLLYRVVDPSEMNQWVFAGGYFLYISLLIWIGGMILIKNRTGEPI